MSPHLYKANDGLLYLIPMWQVVPQDTTIDDIIWVNPYKRSIVTQVKSSRNNTMYTISRVGKKLFCNCPASKWKSTECKHIKQLSV